jgi:hypothetical protein
MASSATSPLAGMIHRNLNNALVAAHLQTSVGPHPMVRSAAAKATALGTNSLALRSAKLVACSATNVSPSTRGCTDMGQRIPLQVCFRNQRYVVALHRGCTVTARLYRRFNKLLRSQQYDPISRAQADVASITDRQIRQGMDATLVDVTFHWSYRANRPYHLTFVVIPRGMDWLVDNTYCTGRPSTTVYKTPEPTC